MPSLKSARPSLASRASAQIDVRPSSIHGLGVFALVDIEAGHNVGNYAGKRYASDVVRPDWDGQVTYLFALSDGTMIDGARGGNATRHINHSCHPNVEALEVTTPQGRLRIHIHAKRAIRAGEELLLDYSLVVDEEDPSAYPCRCGAKACRGSLVAVAEPA